MGCEGGRLHWLYSDGGVPPFPLFIPASTKKSQDKAPCAGSASQLQEGGGLSSKQIFCWLYSEIKALSEAAALFIAAL